MGGHQEPLLDPVRRLYEESLQAHGTTSRAVGWNDEASQRLRFEKLAAVIASGESALRVNDLGCGYGAMFDFLAARFGDRLAAYHGIDISGEMVAAARARVRDARASFAASDTLHDDADYTFASGTFNVRMDASEEQWTAHVEASVLAMAAKSRKGLAFNLLSTYVDWRAERLYYADPCHFFDFCRRRVSRFVTLLHDYPLYEWTILVRT